MTQETEAPAEALIRQARESGHPEWLTYAARRREIPDNLVTLYPGGPLSPVSCATELAKLGVTWSDICYMKS